jgi:hypothetical protein
MDKSGKEQNKAITCGLVAGIMILLVIFYGTSTGSAWLKATRSSGEPAFSPITQIVEYTSNFELSSYQIQILNVKDDSSVDLYVNNELVENLKPHTCHQLRDGMSICLMYLEGNNVFFDLVKYPLSQKSGTTQTYTI